VLIGIKSIGPTINYLAPLLGCLRLQSGWEYAYTLTLTVSFLLTASVSMELYRKIKQQKFYV